MSVTLNGSDTGTRRLLELGIRQQLHRPLRWTQNSMICFCILSSTTCITVSGGLYYWSFMLAGKHGAFASWIVGWINLLGQVALVAGAVYTGVQILTGVLFLLTRDSHDVGYYPSNGMQLYLYLGLLLVNSIINSIPLRVLARVAKIGVMWSVADEEDEVLRCLFTQDLLQSSTCTAGVLAMTAVLLTVAPQQQKWSWVLFDFESNPISGISSKVHVVLVGVAAASWPLMGYDSVAHLIEETKSADAMAGRPMPWVIITSFLTGLVYIIALTLCIQNWAAITSPPENLSVVNTVALIFWDIFEARYGWGQGGALLLLVPLGSAIFFGIHCSTSAARMLYGFSRDRAVPFCWLWTQVDDQGVPVYAVWGIACAAFVMGLSLLHGAAVFNTCSSIASAGLCIDYALPIGFRLFLARNNFEPGPFTLGRWGPAVHFVSLVWLTFTAATFCLPTVYPITMENFNFTPVVLGGVLLLATLSWMLSARFWFTGPRVDVDNSDLVRIKYWVLDPPVRTLRTSAGRSES